MRLCAPAQVVNITPSTNFGILGAPAPASWIRAQDGVSAVVPTDGILNCDAIRVVRIPGREGEQRRACHQWTTRRVDGSVAWRYPNAGESRHNNRVMHWLRIVVRRRSVHTGDHDDARAEQGRGGGPGRGMCHAVRASELP